MKKYELTTEAKVWLGRTLHRIRALVSFGDVEAGELGGWIEKEENLEQSGDAWVYGDARVYGDAWVSGDARVYGEAQVSGDAWVYGDARVSGDADVNKDTHYLVIGAIGSRDDFTTFFRTKNKQIFVCCGCFEGDINKFVEAVKETHGGTKHEKAYMLAVELAKAQIEDVESEGDYRHD